MKIAIIGVGHVGSTIAYSMIPHCKKISLLDSDLYKLDGEITDLRHAGYLINKRCEIKKGTIEEAKRTHVIIITAGIAWTMRNQYHNTDLLYGNLPILEGILEKFRGYRGQIYVVTNPPERLCNELRKNFALNLYPIGYQLDETRRKVDGKQGSYIKIRKGHTNWGIAAQTTREVIG